jgi:hypothetical protein
VRARRDSVVLGAVAAALLAAIVAFAASSGVQNGAPSPTPTPTTAQSRERYLFGGDLEPGVRYQTRAFVPALSFTVSDEDWIARDSAGEDYLLLERRAPEAPSGRYPGRAWLAFSRLPFVYEPRTGRPVTAPAPLHDWLRRHPDLAVGAQRPAELAGVQGSTFTTRVRFGRPAVFAPECILPDVVCTAIAPNRFLLNGARMRTYVLDTSADDPLVIDLIGAAPRDLQALREPAAAALVSLQITRR